MTGQNILSKAAVVTIMKPTTFKTGSDGFRGQAKVVEGDEKYQVQVLAIRIGSGKNGKK
jgi:hypothetical protein